MALTQIKTTGIADDAVTTDKLANAINTERTANTAKVSLENDSVTGAKIADDAVGAEHIEVLDAALQFGDNVKVQFGAGNDLEIYHHGSWGSSYINNSGSGAFFIESDDIRFRKADNSELYFQAVANGAVELYYDNSKKLETTSAGAKVTGDLFFNDSHAIKLGTGQDLWLYNDGTNSYVNNVAGGGHLILQGNGDAGKVVAINPKHGENGLVANADGAVELYYDNVKTFETADNGIKVVASENNHARIHMWADDGDDGPDKWEILATTQGQLRFYHGASFENTIVLNGDGAVELYYDNSKKFETYSAGVEWHGNLKNETDGVNEGIYLGAQNDFGFWHDGSNSFIKNLTGELKLLADQFRVNNYANNEQIISSSANGAVELYYDGAKKLFTYSEGTKIDGYIKALYDSSDSHWGDNTDNWHHIQNKQDDAHTCIFENSSDSTPYGNLIYFTDCIPDNNTQTFLEGHDTSAIRFKIYSDGDLWNHDNVYTGSDQTLKENIVDATPKLEDLKKLKVRNFNWKAEHFPEKSKKKQLGFIAQEVEEVFPALVSEHDIAPGTPGDGHVPVIKKAIKQAWDPIIIKAMQELIEKVETLETEVAALKAK